MTSHFLSADQVQAPPLSLPSRWHTWARRLLRPTLRSRAHRGPTQEPPLPWPPRMCDALVVVHIEAATAVAQHRPRNPLRRAWMEFFA